MKLGISVADRNRSPNVANGHFGLPLVMRQQLEHMESVGAIGIGEQDLMVPPVGTREVSRAMAAKRGAEHSGNLSNPAKPEPLRIDKAAQPRRRDAGKTHRQCAAPGGIEPGYATVAQYRSTEHIRHHQATFVWDQRLWKVVRHGKIKAIREVAVVSPFVISTEIGD